MVIGVQPVRARCGYRLCLTQRKAVNPNNDASHLDLTAVASAPRSSQAADRQHQHKQARRFRHSRCCIPGTGEVDNRRGQADRTDVVSPSVSVEV